MTTQKIYLYSENCTLKGRPFSGGDDEAAEFGDVFLWGEGTDEELIAQAIESLAKPCNRAPHFRHKCDRNVLEMLGGPQVEPQHDSRGSYWTVAVEESDDE